MKRSYEPHPKPSKRRKQHRARIIDPEALVRKLFQDSMCRARGCGKRAVHPHHIVLKSQLGDDVEANIMPLCERHHNEYHDRGFLLAFLTPMEYGYTVSKLGREAAADYVLRKYGMEVPE